MSPAPPRRVLPIIQGNEAKRAGQRNQSSYQGAQAHPQEAKERYIRSTVEFVVVIVELEGRHRYRRSFFDQRPQHARRPAPREEVRVGRSAVPIRALAGMRIGCVHADPRLGRSTTDRVHTFTPLPGSFAQGEHPHGSSLRRVLLPAVPIGHQVLHPGGIDAPAGNDGDVLLAID